MTRLRRDRRRRRPQRPDRRPPTSRAPACACACSSAATSLGGACVTEELWPGQRVSRASYVVSMLQPEGRRRPASSSDFGYDPIPLDPPFATFAADGSADPLPQRRGAPARASLARVSPQRRRRDAGASRRCWSASADFLRPMMLRPPPALGSKRPGDVLELLREAGARRRPAPPRHPGPLPRDDDVGRRPARRLVRERRAQGRLRVDRRGRRVGRPAHARHRLQPAAPRARRARRRRRRVGARARRHGRDLARRSRRSARAVGAAIRTGAAVRVDRRRATAACTGVTLASRRGAPGADRALRRAPEDDGARPGRRRALPRRGRRATCAATAPAAGR